MPVLNRQGVAFIFIIVGVVQAYTVFNPTCSTPEKPANFVGSPDSRGTLDILWSCLFTIFACTWSVQHLNVPEQREGRDPGWRGDFWWMLKGIWSKSKWMITTVIAPEFTLAYAAGGLAAARTQQQSMRPFAEEDGVEWTLTHSMFANMGGFVIRFGTVMESTTGQLPLDIEMQGGPLPSHPTVSSARIGNDSFAADVNKDESIEETPALQIRDQAASNEVEISGLESGLDNKPWESHTVSPVTAVLTEADKQPGASSCQKLYHLSGSEIIKLRSEGQLKKIPRITKDEINDKSKNDSFAKAIALGQISWTVIQVCVRGARGLAIAQLEIAVIAFSVCAVVIYAVQWSTPKDVRVPITLIQCEGPIPSKVLELLENKNQDDGRWGENISNTASSNYDEFSGDIVFTGVIVGALVFGAPHIGAWNFKFPTQIEQIIWRGTSIYCTCIGITFFSLGIVSYVITSAFPRLFADTGDWMMYITLGSYVVGRLFILVEIFRSLCFLPPSAYTSTWASSLPHVG
jgi:hypothetical protein